MSKYNRQSFWRETSTFRRLLRSQHVRDLRLIFFTTLLAVIGASVLIYELTPYAWTVAEAVKKAAADAVAGAAVDPAAKAAADAAVKAAADTAAKSAYTVLDTAKFIGAIAAAGATVMAWAYQAGSKRLGVVDLFACEIVTLCRVGTVVEFIPTMIAQYNSIGLTQKKPVHSEHQKKPIHSEHPPQALGFNSKENYFPVFESNSKDLQILEADVVNNVTAFYTYMKATRDVLRQLGDLRLSGAPDDDQRKAVINVIFMVFLAYESARRAIDALIEYEPTHAEDTIILLFTELPAYRFLRGTYAPEGKFPDEIRAQRLQLRLAEYQKFIPKLSGRVRKHAGKRKWERANGMVAGLDRVFVVVEAEAMKVAADQPLPSANAA